MDILLVAVIGFLFGATCAAAVYGFFYDRQKQETRRRHVARIKELKESGRLLAEGYREKLEEKDYEIRRLTAHFDLRVEKEVQVRIREWTPDERDAEAAFEEAERMAKRRRTLDAGRSHPPRADGGEPARVHTLTLKR